MYLILLVSFIFPFLTGSAKAARTLSNRQDSISVVQSPGRCRTLDTLEQEVSASNSTNTPGENLANWCGVEDPKGTGWFSCPVCIDDCATLTSPPMTFWLHWKRMPSSKADITLIVGDETPNQHTSCANLFLNDIAELAILTRLGEFGEAQGKMSPVCSSLHMKTFARWTAALAKNLGMPDLMGVDESFFVCEEIQTLPLRLLKTGRTLYGSMFDGPAALKKASFSWEDHCKELADKIVSQTTVDMKAAAQKALDHTLSIKGKKDMCATEQGKAAIDAYKAVIDMQPLLEELLKDENECRAFEVDLEKAHLSCD